MSEDWPGDVQTAIMWHHEAEVAAVRAKRAFELAETMAYAEDLQNIPAADLAWRRAAGKPRVEQKLKAERAALDAAELEEAKRHRWLCFVIGRENRS